MNEKNCKKFPAIHAAAFGTCIPGFKSEIPPFRFRIFLESPQPSADEKVHRLVTVIVVCYKNTNTLFKTLDSILEQDYLQIQLIVSDDASADFQVEQIKRYIDEHKYSNITDTLVRANTQNLGIVKHLNKILEFITGEYIKLIPPGDTFQRTSSLAEMVKAINNCGVLVSPVLAHGRSVKYLTPSKKTIKKLSTSTELEVMLYARNEINIIGTLFRSELIRQQIFDENYYLLEDWPLWLKLSRQGVRFKFSENIYCEYALGGISTSGRNVQLRSDIIRLFEREILPNLGNCCHKVCRETIFEYRKNVLRQGTGKLQKLLFVAKYLDVIIRRKTEYYCGFVIKKNKNS
jgi:glycosyltransferase involved in cell wall biosynthesis